MEENITIIGLVLLWGSLLVSMATQNMAYFEVGFPLAVICLVVVRVHRAKR